MLKELCIENLAIIEKAVISFSDKLNIFSGETGAGKSILIGGINAILGGRVYKDIVRSGTEKAQVTALFENVPVEVMTLAVEYGYAQNSHESQIVLMREISIDGKSTARINGKTATASVLREIAARLINIHGQHDTQLLTDGENQRIILDSYGNLQIQLLEYADCFKELQGISRKIKRLQAEEALKTEKIAMLTEKVNEIGALNLSSGDEERIFSELKILQNSKAVEQQLNKVYYTLTGFDENIGVIDNLQKSYIDLNEIHEFLPISQKLSERINGVIIELDDIKSELLSSVPSEGDKSRFNFLEEQAANIQRLKRKYGMTIDELIVKFNKWKDELNHLEFSDDLLKKLLEEKKNLGEKIKKLGTEITQSRKKVASQLTEKITQELRYLDMPNVQFVFDIKQDKVTITGMDSVRMLISVNKGETPKPIERIASGGELSRIMLAIKSVLSESDNISTMIFDEIDTGISGRAAQKVGIKLKNISRKCQVLCVTHLAQIAAMADLHLMIEKTSDEDRTYTKVEPLSEEGRKRELARIISGDSENEASLKNAEELLNMAEKF